MSLWGHLLVHTKPEQMGTVSEGPLPSELLLLELVAVPLQLALYGASSLAVIFFLSVPVGSF